MRITNPQKSDLKLIIKEVGLLEEMFDFTGEDDFFQIKFKENYFTFHIKMEEPDTYLNSINYVNQKSPHSIRQIWKDTLNQFRYWALGIAEDVKHNPKSFNIANIDFPPDIVEYSATFPEIYKQALTAETNGLTEICGLGYRKAFEFLIRDYLLQKHPIAEHDKIKSMPASQCINQYVTSDEIKLVSHRVLWLGNDHAHYLKKWEDKNLSDLKSLIDLTIRWILIRDELTKLEQSMPNGK